MENLPPLGFTLGTGAFTPPSMSRREARTIRQNNQEIIKRLREDAGTSTMSPPLLFQNTISIPQLFPSLLSILPDIPSYIKIILATETKSLKGRQEYIERKTFENIRFSRTLAKIPKDTFGYTATQMQNGILGEHIEEVRKWFALEQKIRTQMRRLVQHWLYKRYKNRIHNETDPCTLEPISNPICIFDMATRGYYQFDAKSLRRTVDFGLGFQDWMFAEPQMPKNPLTNLEFTVGQFAAIQTEIRKAGFGSWMMEGFTKSNWNLDQFKLNYSVPLKLNALHSLYKNPKSEQTQEFLTEFIEDQWEAHDMTKLHIKTILRWAVKHEMDDAYMQKWLDVWYDYFKLKVQYGLRDASSDRLNAVFAKTLLLLENSVKIAEFGERRLAEMKVARRIPFDTLVPIPTQLITTTTTVRTYITNPMLVTQSSVILNPEDVDTEEEDDDEREPTAEEEITFSTPQEIASFMEFISQLFGENENP